MQVFIIIKETVIHPESRAVLVREYDVLTMEEVVELGDLYGVDSIAGISVIARDIEHALDIGGRIIE